MELTDGYQFSPSTGLHEFKLRNLVNNAILESLEFPSMNTRYEDTVQAFPKTFQWVLQTHTSPEHPWSDFGGWLKAGKGVYWINGKAGSGKTTLMKHIFDDPQVHHYLSGWAKDTRLCIATFFFWGSGTREQRSQSGMLRTILSQILTTIPELTPILMPQIWAKIYTDCIGGTESPSFSWTLHSLKSAFSLFVQQRQVPLKTCFLVDGLDEFDGEPNEILPIFKEIGSTDSIKACLSSRPKLFSNKLSDYILGSSFKT